MTDVESQTTPKLWPDPVPVTITYTPRWWQFWKKPYSIQVSREEAQMEYNKFLNACIRKVRPLENDHVKWISYDATTHNAFGWDSDLS